MPRSFLLTSVASLAALLLVPTTPSPAFPPVQKLTAQEVASRLEKAGTDPVLLLDIAALAEAGQAQRIRQQIKPLLQPPLARDDAERLARRMAPVLSRAVATAEELREVLGPPRSVARQILFRRCLEQWVYDAPLPLVAVFDWPQGQDRRLQSVRTLTDGKP